jgi:hypothetical protein
VEAAYIGSPLGPGYLAGIDDARRRLKRSQARKRAVDLAVAVSQLLEGTGPEAKS